jgi:hypothetical protein
VIYSILIGHLSHVTYSFGQFCNFHINEFIINVFMTIIITLLRWLIWNAFVRRVGASDNIRSKRQTASCRTFVLSSCRLRCTHNCALSCGVWSRCHTVARFKLKDWLISQATSRQRTARQRAVWRFASDNTTKAIAI